MTRRLCAAFLAALLAGCARAPTPPEAVPARPAAFPEAYYRDAAARGDAVYRIDPARSLATVRVYRAGPLARFGHEHVIAARRVHGYVRLAQERSRGDLYVRLAELEVDPPRLRAEAGLAPLSADDVAATRRNMLEAVLEAERFPYAYLRLQPIVPGAERVRVAAELTLHGRTHALPVEVRLARPDDGVLEASGTFALRQSDFAITPFSALAGALRVADRVDVSFRLRAQRVPPSAATMPRAGRSS